MMAGTKGGKTPSLARIFRRVFATGRATTLMVTFSYVVVVIQIAAIVLPAATVIVGDLTGSQNLFWISGVLSILFTVPKGVLGVVLFVFALSVALDKNSQSRKGAFVIVAALVADFAAYWMSNGLFILATTYQAGAVDLGVMSGVKLILEIVWSIVVCGVIVYGVRSARRGSS